MGKRKKKRVSSTSSSGGGLSPGVIAYQTGNAIGERNDPANALEHYRRAITLLSPRDPYLPPALQGAGEACFRLGRIDEANRYLSQAAELHTRTRNGERLGSALHSLADSARAGADWRSAEIYYRRAIEVLHSAGKPLEEGAAWNCFGKWKMIMGSNSTAKEAFLTGIRLAESVAKKEALNEYEREKVPALTALCLLGLGDISRTKDKQYQEALEYYQATEAESRKYPSVFNLITLAVSLQYQAETLLRLHWDSSFIEPMREASQILEKCGSPLEQADCQMLFGTLHLWAKNYTSAYRELSLAREWLENLEVHSKLAECYERLAILAGRDVLPLSAEEYRALASSCAHRSGNKILAAQTDVRWGINLERDASRCAVQPKCQFMRRNAAARLVPAILVMEERKTHIMSSPQRQGWSRDMALSYKAALTTADQLKDAALVTDLVEYAINSWNIQAAAVDSHVTAQPWSLNIPTPDRPSVHDIKGSKDRTTAKRKAPRLTPGSVRHTPQTQALRGPTSNEALIASGAARLMAGSKLPLNPVPDLLVPSRASATGYRIVLGGWTHVNDDKSPVHQSTPLPTW